MKANEFREQIVKSVKTFVRKYKPATLSIQCPLTITEYRHPYWRQKLCKACRWRSNLYNGETSEGENLYHCRRMLGDEIRVIEKTPACPWYEN